MYRKLTLMTGLLLLAIITAGCGRAARPTQSPPENTRPEPATSTPATAAVEAAPPDTTDTRVEPDPAAERPASAGKLAEIPQPVNVLADSDYHWSQLLARDAIAPIYEPEFTPAAQAPYDDNELVIGVEINGQARAYAIGPLNSREMVNDTVGGVPILVTW